MKKIIFFGLKERIVEFILGLGKKQFFDTSKCFLILISNY